MNVKTKAMKKFYAVIAMIIPSGTGHSPHTRQLKDGNVIPAGIAGIQMPRMASLTSTSMCSGCRQSLPT